MQGFAAVEILFIISFLIGFCHFHASTRQRMMIMKFVACLFSGTYFYLIGADTAMMAVMIAGLGGLTQAFFADHMLAKTRMLRTGIAVSLAAASIYMCAGSSLEALPLIAVINSRLMEIQACRQRIRIGYVFSMMCWITYAISSGLILLYVTENLNMLSNLYAIWKEERKRKKVALVPAYAS